MGVAFKDIIPAQTIELADLKGKIVVIDGFNLLYQFLTSIRAPDGSLLMDSHRRITSHLVGLFSRIPKLMEAGIKVAVVFDGVPPALKAQERERRRALKMEAETQYEAAKQAEDVESMKKFAARTTRLTEDMIADAKLLLSLLGIPVIQAPSEGEAQAAYMAAKGDCYAVVSQDYDSLIYGAPVVVRNLSLVGKRKQTDKLAYTVVKPELVTLSSVLNTLGIDRDQLIVLAMLIGTDYNPGGIKGIGPQKGLSLVKKCGKDFDTLFTNQKWSEFFSFPWGEAYSLIKNMPVTDDYLLRWSPVDVPTIMDFLIEREFSEERVKNTLEKLSKKADDRRQKSLFEFK